MTTALKKAFEDLRLPTVRVIILPAYAHELLKSCQNVREVTCIGRKDGSTLVGSIAKSCKFVEKIEGFLVDKNMMKRIVKAIPNLRFIKFRGNVSVETLRLLSSMKKLITIELETRGLLHEPDSTQLKECVTEARNILRQRHKNDPEERKYLRIWYDTPPGFLSGTTSFRDVEIE